MRNKFYVLFLILFAFTFTSCDSGKKTVYVTQNPKGSVTLKSADFNSEEKSENYDTYIYIADYTFETAEDTTASVTLCLNQGEKNPIPERKVFNHQEYTDFGFAVSNCTSVDIPVKAAGGKVTLPFNLLNSIMDVSSKQQLDGDTKIFTFVNDSVSDVHYLGTITIYKIKPSIFAEKLSYTDIVASGPWSIAKGIKPTYIEIPITAEITLSGSGADDITVSAEDMSETIVTKMKMSGYNGKKLPDISFELDNISFLPTKIKTDLKDGDNQTVDSVDISVISTTDEQHLPYIGMTFTMKIPFADVEKYIPSLGSKGEIVDPAYSPTEAVLPVSFTAKVIRPDGEIFVDTDSFNINVVDFIYDVSDMWRLLYNAEMFNGVDAAKKDSPAKMARASNAAEDVLNPANFSPVKYEAPFFQESGSKSSFYGNIKFLAGVYTEIIEEEKYQMRVQADGSSSVSVIGYNFDVFTATIYATGQPRTPGSTEDDSELKFGYTLTVFGKAVLSDNMTAGGRFEFKKHYTFEKEFSSQGSIVVIVPFYYDVGGRGAVGVVPELTVGIKNEPVTVPQWTWTKIENTYKQPERQPWDLLETVKVVNTEKVLPWYVRIDPSNPDVSRKVRDAQLDYTYIFDKLPDSAKNFLIEKGLENDIVEYEEFIEKRMVKALKVTTGLILRREWNTRETNNINHDAWMPFKYEMVKGDNIQQTALGFDVEFKARPYIDMSGYGKGGFGVANDWKLLKFSLGVGVEAVADPLIYAHVWPEVTAFIGIAGKNTANPDDKNKLLLQLKYKAPFKYLLIKGKIWAGVHLKASVWLFAWVDVVNGKWGRTLVDNKGIGGTYEIVKPFDQTWLFNLPDNTKP